MRFWFFTVCLSSILFVGCGSLNTAKVAGQQSDRVWRAETIRLLAEDLRDDGNIDYVWSETVPDDVQNELIRAAETLNHNHTGE